MRWISLTILPMLIFGEARAQSLFFTSDETSAIEAAVAAAPKPQLDAYQLKLGAIMYYGPGQWTIWLNDRAYRPDAMPDEIEITQVTENRVSLRITRPVSGKSLTATLAPRQSLNLLTGQVSGEAF